MPQHAFVELATETWVDVVMLRNESTVVDRHFGGFARVVAHRNARSLVWI